MLSLSQGVLSSAAGWQIACPLLSLMHDEPAPKLMQSAAVMHSLRHAPRAQMSGDKQSLLR
jgi:hypothetical protein